MFKNLILIVLFTLCNNKMLSAAPSLSAAEEAEIQKAIESYQERPWELGLAAGYGVRTNPLIHSDDIPMYAVINAAWFGDWFFFDNGDLGVTVHESDKLSINFIAHINGEREVFEWLNNSRLGIHFATGAAADFSPPANDSSGTEESSLFPPEVTENLQEQIEIPKRNLAVDGGLEIGYADVWGDLQLQILTDLSFTHKGAEVWASYAYPWQHGNWKIVPSVGISWKSHNLLNYYYGVRNSEVRLNRPAYTARSGFNGFVKLSLAYHFNEHWGIVGVAEYEALSRSIRRSPIVDQNSIETLFIGLMYNF